MKILQLLLLVMAAETASCDEDGRSEAYWARCTCGWSARVGNRAHITSEISAHKSGGCRR